MIALAILGAYASHTSKDAEGAFSYSFALMLIIVSIIGGRREIVKRLDSLVSSCVVRHDAELRQNLLKSLAHIVAIPQPARHSHREAAELRTSVTAAVSQSVLAAGRRPYAISPRSREKHDGVRKYHHLLDLHEEHREDALLAHHIITLIDVDYYLNINDVLRHGLPVIIYTFRPQHAAGIVPNGSFTTGTDNKITLSVDGGARYVHELWDYDGSCVAVENRNEFGYEEVHVFNIEFLQCESDVNRRVVLFTPSVTLPKCVYMMLSHIRDSFPTEITNPIKRVKMAYKTVAATTYKILDTHMVSLASFDSPNDVSIDLRTLSAIKTKMKVSTANYVSSVERMLSNYSNKAELAPIIFAYLMDDSQLLPMVAKSSPCKLGPANDRTYQSPGPLVTEDALKAYAVRIAPDVVTDPAVFPGDTYNNDHHGVEQRVTRMLNDRVPPRDYEKYAAEFLRKLVPKELVGRGRPLNIDEVLLKQQKPRQIINNVREMNELGEVPFMVRAFGKKEAYPAPKPQRNISTVPRGHCLELSAYTYAFKSNILETHHWYGPGQNPQELLDAVNKIAGSEPYLVTKDYSKFDGTISEWLYVNVAKAAMTRYFSFVEVPKLVKLLDSETLAKGVTKNGVSYDTGFSRLSGSPVTTDHNTIINAFVSYAALRASQDPERAWSKLGLYYGDDGIDRCLSTEDLIQAGDDLGLTTKAQAHPQHEPVPFLGRYLVDPWASQDSFQDPWRTIPKINFSLNSDPKLSNAQKASNRATAYLATDALTPIVGPWCRTIQRIYGEANVDTMSIDETTHMTKAWPQVDKEAIHRAFLQVSAIGEDECNTFEKHLYDASIANLGDVVIENWTYTPSPGFTLPSSPGEPLIKHVNENGYSTKDPRLDSTKQVTAAEQAAERHHNISPQQHPKPPAASDTTQAQPKSQKSAKLKCEPKPGNELYGDTRLSVVCSTTGSGRFNDDAIRVPRHGVHKTDNNGGVDASVNGTRGHQHSAKGQTRHNNGHQLKMERNPPKCDHPRVDSAPLGDQRGSTNGHSSCDGESGKISQRRRRQKSRRHKVKTPREPTKG